MTACYGCNSTPTSHFFPAGFGLSFCFVSFRFFSRCFFFQLQNANGVKTIRLGDFGPSELAQLNSTIQLDWKLYEAVLENHHSLAV